MRCGPSLRWSNPGPVKRSMRYIRQSPSQASRASLAPTNSGRRLTLHHANPVAGVAFKIRAGARLLERGLPAKLTTRRVRQTGLAASRASLAPTNSGRRLTHHHANPVAGIAVKIRAGARVLERGLPAKLTTRRVRQTGLAASRASLAPTRSRTSTDPPSPKSGGRDRLQNSGWCTIVGARLAREVNDAPCQTDRVGSFAGKPRSNKV